MSFFYKKDNPVLKNINLKINKGEFTAIAGPNGCGKTTLIKLICNLLKLKEGKIQFNGLSMQDIRVKCGIFYLPSDDYLPEFLNGIEYIHLLGRLYHKKIAQEEIDFFLRYLKLDDACYEIIETYSFGMKKKLQIICALLVNPELLIIDETLNGIDVESKMIIKLLLNNYVKEGGTILFCSHDLDLVEELCERVVILYDGKIYLDQLTQDIKNTTLEKIFMDLINMDVVKSEIESGLQSFSNY